MSEKQLDILIIVGGVLVAIAFLTWWTWFIWVYVGLWGMLKASYG